MRTRPVNAPTTDATTEPRRSGKHVRGYDVGYLFTQHIDKLTVALAAARILQGRLRPQIQAPKDLDQLILEIIGPDEHRPRAGGCQPSISGQQPTSIDSGLLLKYSILQPRLEKDAVEAEEPQPPRQRTQHRVAQKAWSASSGVGFDFHNGNRLPPIIKMRDTRFEMAP